MNTVETVSVDSTVQAQA